MLVERKRLKLATVFVGASAMLASGVYSMIGNEGLSTRIFINQEPINTLTNDEIVNVVQELEAISEEDITEETEEEEETIVEVKEVAENITEEQLEEVIPKDETPVEIHVENVAVDLDEPSTEPEEVLTVTNNPIPQEIPAKEENPKEVINQEVPEIPAKPQENKKVSVKPKTPAKTKKPATSKQPSKNSKPKRGDRRSLNENTKIINWVKARLEKWGVRTVTLLDFPYEILDYDAKLIHWKENEDWFFDEFKAHEQQIQSDLFREFWNKGKSTAKDSPERNGKSMRDICRQAGLTKNDQIANDVSLFCSAEKPTKWYDSKIGRTSSSKN